MNSEKSNASMGWAFIDTATAGTFRVGMLSKTKSTVRERAGRSHLALNELAKIVARCPLPVARSIDGICVVSGPGSFSAVRTGVLTANLLSRLFKKPLVGVSSDEAQDVELLAKRLADGDIPPSTYVAPVYDAEPNITIKK